MVFSQRKFFRFNWFLVFVSSLWNISCLLVILRDHTVPNFHNSLRYISALSDLFYLSPVTSFTWCFLSKILRGHIVPHFLRYPLSSLLLGSLQFSPLIFFPVFFSWRLLSKILRGHIVPHFLRFLFIFSSYLTNLFYSLRFILCDSAWSYCPALSHTLLFSAYLSF